ncbi:MAG: glycoside hydrolase family 1 protein [Clostridiales bacterium]|nr:glycoside hydrolase family 1 protein [Clostridiales bacterium]
MIKLRFELGVASAATQIEGGELDHTWNDWYRRGHIKDGSNPARANDHYHLWEEDFALMRDMGLKHYRLGVEWARIEPREGEFDEKELMRYRQMLLRLAEYGIRPLVTLHHFTNPMWFENLGGFERMENAPLFLRFVEKTVAYFGDACNEYVTINEPNVYAAGGYYGMGFPPGKNSFGAVNQVMSVLAACHCLAYEAIHRLRRQAGFTDTKVGFAHHARAFAPQNPHNPWHRLAARLNAYLFQETVLRAFCLGEYRWPLRNLMKLPRRELVDFHGLNYYSRSSVCGLADGVAKDGPKNDLGWEIYPQGMILCAQEMEMLLPRPLYITENGTCDNRDAFRCRYLYDHLKALSESGLPVQRYYHWCFCDNFEWLEGESARFGLVHVDYDTQKRTVKNSGRFYGEMAKSGVITQEMVRQYVAEENYHD